MEIGTEKLLNADNDIVLYLDTDLNTKRGWRSVGSAPNSNGTSDEIGDLPIRRRRHRDPARAAPVHWASQRDLFRLRDESEPQRAARRSHLLFSGPQIRILLWDRTGGDRLPDDGESVTYTFDQGTLPPENLIPLRKVGR